MNIEQGEPRPKVGEIPTQTLPHPGRQADMQLQPDSNLSGYLPAGKLKGKVAIITGGDSGIGRAVAVAFAMEGANVSILYNDDMETPDAQTTKTMVEARGGKCLVIQSDVRDPQLCRDAVAQTIQEFSGLNILVNNAAWQKTAESLEDTPDEDIRRTFDTNILGYIWMAKAALPHLKEGDCIINTGSTTALHGQAQLIPYSSTKGAIHVFTKSLGLSLAERKIRVNCVVPGPVWTPAIPASSPKEALKQWGAQTVVGRSGQPDELGPAFVFLASQGDSSFINNSLLEVSGGFRSVD